MPRKATHQPRTTRATKKRARAVPSRARKRIFHQCLLCGAPVDPMFGLGLEGWCPHCEQPDGIDCREGQLPDPVFYGRWLQRQKKNASSSHPDPKGADQLSHSHFTQGVTTMKQTKTHTGTYCCPDCCIEFNLVAEESLKCDRCSGPLAKGSLEDYWADEGDEGYHGDQE